MFLSLLRILVCASLPTGLWWCRRLAHKVGERKSLRRFACLPVLSVALAILLLQDMHKTVGSMPSTRLSQMRAFTQHSEQGGLLPLNNCFTDVVNEPAEHIVTT